MTWRSLDASTVGAQRDLDQPRRHRSAGAKCACGDALRFATDRIGRTVEQCGGCGYEGAVRLVRSAEPPPPRAEYFRQRYEAKKSRTPSDPNAFRCGHPRSPENTYEHPRGWDECRQCGRDRNKIAKAARRAL